MTRATAVTWIVIGMLLGMMFTAFGVWFWRESTTNNAVQNGWSISEQALLMFSISLLSLLVSFVHMVKLKQLMSREKRARRKTLEQCRWCGYSRHGISHAAECPECGRKEPHFSGE